MAPRAANPFAACRVICLKLRSCSPSPFGPWFAHRPRAGTNSIAQCFWRNVSHPLGTRAHGLGVALEQRPVEAGVHRVRGCVSIRSWRASLTPGNTARHVSTEKFFAKPRVVFDIVSFAKFRSSADSLISTKTLYQPPNREATQSRCRIRDRCVSPSDDERILFFNSTRFRLNWV